VVEGFFSPTLVNLRDFQLLYYQRHRLKFYSSGADTGFEVRGGVTLFAAGGLGAAQRPPVGPG
jgi:hypothetical protein